MRRCRNNCETERRTQSSAFTMIEKAVGIIGGIGPMSTVYFMEMIINMTDAAKDQEHINMVVLNHATIPDLSKSMPVVSASICAISGMQAVLPVSYTHLCAAADAPCMDFGTALQLLWDSLRGTAA